MHPSLKIWKCIVFFIALWGTIFERAKLYKMEAIEHRIILGNINSALKEGYIFGKSQKKSVNEMNHLHLCTRRSYSRLGDFKHQTKLGLLRISV